MHNVRVAVELIIIQTTTSITTIRSSWAKWVGFGQLCASAQAGQNPRVKYCNFQADMLYSGSILQNHAFSRQTPWKQPICCLFLDYVRAGRSLRGALFLLVSLRFRLTGNWSKSCSSSLSDLDLNKIYEKFFSDHRMPLQIV